MTDRSTTDAHCLSIHRVDGGSSRRAGAFAASGARGALTRGVAAFVLAGGTCSAFGQAAPVSLQPFPPEGRAVALRSSVLLDTSAVPPGPYNAYGVAFVWIPVEPLSGDDPVNSLDARWALVSVGAPDSPFDPVPSNAVTYASPGSAANATFLPVPRVLSWAGTMDFNVWTAPSPLHFWFVQGPVGHVATWQSVTVQLVQIPVTPPTIETGNDLTLPQFESKDFTLTPGQVQWYKLTIPADVDSCAGSWLDIHTYFDPLSNQTLKSQQVATSMGLYREDGTIITTEFGDGPNAASLLTLGAATSRPAFKIIDDVAVPPEVPTFAQTFGRPRNGADGALTSGTYYLAIGGEFTIYRGGFVAQNLDPAAGPARVSFPQGAGAIFQPGVTTFAEVEPNNTKVQANIVPLTDGQTLRGSSRVGTASDGSPDYFRVTTPARAAGAIFRSRVAIASGNGGNILSLRGLLQQAAGVVPGTDVAIQFGVRTTTAPNYVQWYSHGPVNSDVYLSVTGSTASDCNYRLTYDETPVVPFTIPVTYVPGSVTFSTVGQTPPGLTITDTSMWLYDAALRPVAVAGNDDWAINPDDSIDIQSQFSKNLAGGTYYLAISTSPLINNQGRTSFEFAPPQNVADFPGVTISGDADPSPVALRFAITDLAGTTQVIDARTEAWDVNWFKLVVGFPGCNPADIADNAAEPGPDQCVDNGDFQLFINAFFGGTGCPGDPGCNPADIANNGSQPIPDGVLDNGDFQLFITSFFTANCPTCGL
jgi:hypothetical protein